MYEYQATVVSVVDGDTVDLSVSLGFNISIRERFRILGINAPEMHSLVESEKKAAVEARSYLISIIGSGSVLTVRTQKDQKEKYGRYLCQISTPTVVDVAAEMIRAGHAKAYSGGKRT